MDHLRKIGTVLLVLYLLLQTPQIQAQSINPLQSFAAQFLPPEFRNMNLTLDDVKKVFHAKCEKVSNSNNNTLYKEIENAATQSLDCISTIGNLTSLQDEIELARPLGELDSVFHKYCTKVPEVEACIQNFTTKIQHCMTAGEQAQSSTLLRIIKNLLGFLCMKGGDQIALFVAEQGPECLEANKEPLGHCFNATFGELLENANSTGQITQEKFDINNLPELVLSPKHCVDLERFEACTIHHLEQCQEITPANVAESVFRFIKTETNCTNWKASLTTEKSILKKSVKSNTNKLVNISTSLLLLSSIFTLFISYKK